MKETQPKETKQVITEDEFFSVLNQVIASLTEQRASLKNIFSHIEFEKDKNKRIIYYKDASGQVWFEAVDKKIGFL